MSAAKSEESHESRAAFHYAVLEKYFGEEEEQRLIEEDLSAGRYVVGLLFAVVTGGMLMGAAAVVGIFYFA